MTIPILLMLLVAVLGFVFGMCAILSIQWWDRVLNKRNSYDADLVSARSKMNSNIRPGGITYLTKSEWAAINRGSSHL